MATSTALCAMAGTACAQIFVTGFDRSLGSPGFIREYTTSGALVNPMLISGLERPGPIAVSDGKLFVVDKDDPLTSHIGLYTTSGTTVNPELIPGLGQVLGFAVSGDFLYVSGVSADTFTNAVSKYTISGKLVNRFLITGGSAGIAISGDQLFVTFPSFDHSRVGEYTTTGQVVNRNLITGNGFDLGAHIAVSGEKVFLSDALGGPVAEYTTSGALVNGGFINTFSAGDLVTSGDRLFVDNLSKNTISEYTTSGKVVNRALISPSGAIAVVPGSEKPVPDVGSTCLLLLLGLTATFSVTHSIRRA